MNSWAAIFAWTSGLNLGVFLCNFKMLNLLMSLLMLVVATLEWKENRG